MRLGSFIFMRRALCVTSKGIFHLRIMFVSRVIERNEVFVWSTSFTDNAGAESRPGICGVDASSLSSFELLFQLHESINRNFFLTTHSGIHSALMLVPFDCCELPPTLSARSYERKEIIQLKREISLAGCRNSQKVIYQIRCLRRSLWPLSDQAPASSCSRWEIVIDLPMRCVIWPSGRHGEIEKQKSSNPFLPDPPQIDRRPFIYQKIIFVRSWNGSGSFRHRFMGNLLWSTGKNASSTREYFSKWPITEIRWNE